MHEPQFTPKENPIGNNVTSSMRTTLHGGGEDLRSYEAAVLARKAPVNLNLPRRRGEASMNQSFVTDQPANTGVSKVMLNGFSLTTPFSTTVVGGPQEKYGNRGTTMHVTIGTEGRNEKDANSSLMHHVPKSEHDALRPSFKRLASQTLGPESSKRAQLSHDDQEDDDEDDGDGDSAADRCRRMSAPAIRPPHALTQDLKVE
jgi:hypothetical protein